MISRAATLFIRICAIVSVYYAPATLFPLALCTYPMGRLFFPYIILSACTYWVPALTYVAPMLLLPGSNGAFYIDHIAMCVLAYVTLPSAIARVLMAVLIAFKNPRVHKHVCTV
jgi:hypothetical protein